MRSRPLRRRAAKMALPARVRMRSLKPWVLARRRLFGWKVRFMSKLLNKYFDPQDYLIELWMLPGGWVMVFHIK